MATNETTEAKVGRYAAYIDALIAISPKSQATIAKEAGYKNPNNLSLIKSGK
ncbi:XRE family transcriptional regulator, partial [Escherichia sp. HC-TM1]